VPDSVGNNRLLDCLGNALAALPATTGLAVAVSGGPDSSALAVAADNWCQAQNRPLTLLHVHHGLQVKADDWQQQVQSLADTLGRPLLVERVQVDLASGQGVEGAARAARYAALSEMATKHNINAVLLAHHRQDQAETVLMRLLRGAGVTGLAAMTVLTERDGLWWVRPWLDVSRDCIVSYLSTFCAHAGWIPVDDPSNVDVSYARGHLRVGVIPAIERHWPAWRESLVRHAKQAAQAERLLAQYGAQLILQLGVALSEPVDSRAPILSLTLWRELNADEQALAIRTWLQRAGFQMPTDKRLNELMRQLREVHAMGHDRALYWQQTDCAVRCVRGQLHLHARISGSGIDHSNI